METKAIQVYEAQGDELLTHAEGIVIVDDTTRELAVEFVSNTRKAVKAIEAELGPDISAANKLHKDLLARLKKLLSPFKTAQQIVDKEIGRDYLVQENERREKERVAQEKADKEREAQEAQLAKEAEEFIAEGDLDAAEELLGCDVVVNPEVPVEEVKQTVKTGAGSATVRKDIKVELVDKRAALAAVVNGDLPESLVDVNMGAAKRYAKAAELAVMPGFRITETTVVSGRAI